MPGERGSSGVGEKLSIAAVVAAIAAGIAVITLSVGTFVASTAPTGEAGKTKLWHDSTTDRLMSNIANAGAQYVLMSPTYPQVQLGSTTVTDLLFSTTQDVSLTRNAAAQLALTNGVYNLAVIGTGTVNAFHVDDLAGPDVTFRARDAEAQTTYNIPLSSTPGDHTASGVQITFTSNSAHGLVWGQSVTISGFTDSGFNGTYTVYPLNATKFVVDKAGAMTCTVVGTCSAMPALNGGSFIFQPGTASAGGTRGSVRFPGVSTDSTCIGLSASSPTGTDAIAIGSYTTASGMNSMAVGYGAIAEGATENGGEACAVGPNAQTFADYGAAIGPYAAAYAEKATAVGMGAMANIANTVNIAGLDIVQKYNEYKWDTLGNNCARPTVVYGDPVDALATSTTTQTIPTGAHVWVEEVGVIVSSLALDGGAFSTQPTISFGVTGDNDKHKAAAITTTLTAAFSRARYTALLTDVGETSLTMEITVAGEITGGGGGEACTIRPYWVVRCVEDE